MPWLTSLLSDDERDRAARYRFEHNRRQFVIGRGILRVLLGRYLKAGATSFVFHYHSSGKPDLDSDTSEAKLHFNVSHSRDLVLISLSRGREVGVDVEYLDRERAMKKIAARYFSPRELDRIRRLSDSQGSAAYFRHWCGKEALAKGMGEGLISTMGSEDLAGWTLQALPDPDSQYVAALAVAGGYRRLRCLHAAKSDILFRSN